MLPNWKGCTIWLVHETDKAHCSVRETLKHGGLESQGNAMESRQQFSQQKTNASSHTWDDLRAS